MDLEVKINTKVTCNVNGEIRVFKISKVADPTNNAISVDSIVGRALYLVTNLLVV